jgi:hypothetical protein
MCLLRTALGWTRLTAPWEVPPPTLPDKRLEFLEYYSILREDNRRAGLVPSRDKARRSFDGLITSAVSGPLAATEDGFPPERLAQRLKLNCLLFLSPLAIHSSAPYSRMRRRAARLC